MSLTITESCSCGATLTLSGRDSMAVSSPHEAFLKAHKECREKAPVSVQHPSWRDSGRTGGPAFDPSKCPCNPALGGSGICGCVLNSPVIS